MNQKTDLIVYLVGTLFRTCDAVMIGSLRRRGTGHGKAPNKIGKEMGNLQRDIRSLKPLRVVGVVLALAAVLFAG